MASQREPSERKGGRRPTTVIALGAAAVAILVLLLTSGAAGDGWSGFSGLWSSAPPSPASAPASGRAGDPAPPSAQLMRACIKQTKGQAGYEFFLEDIPADQWGEPVKGTLTTSSEAYVLWLFDADCEPHQAVVVPPRTSRTFRAYVGQVWSYTEASAKPPVGGRDCGVFSPSNSGTQEFGDAGRLTYRTG